MLNKSSHPDVLWQAITYFRIFLEGEPGQQRGINFVLMLVIS